MADVIVVGAGWFGLVAAKTYLQINPTVNLIILESSNTIGGTWSHTRVYDGLKTHNAMGGFEISSLSMTELGATATPEGYVKGEDITMYLENFIEKYDLARRIRYNSPVEEIARRVDGLWRLIAGEEGEGYWCKKLIMASGITSKPFVPDILQPAGNETVPVFHSMQLKAWQDFLRSEKVERVTVYGGSKSSFDAVFLYASAGKHVDWVIRPSGQSVTCMFTGTSLGGRVTTAKLGPTRLSAVFSPCIYNYTTWYSRLFHGTALGRSLVRFYWRTMTKICNKEHRLHSTENGRRLIPELGPLGHFWAGGTPPGVASEPRFWDLLHDSGLITVHRAEITSIDKDKVFLSTGTTLQPTSAVILCTGWIRNSTPFSPHHQQALGVPTPLSSVSLKFRKKWDHLDKEAEQSVLQKFPMLEEKPHVKKFEREATPYRLYRLIAPPELSAVGDNSVAFVGTLHTAATGMLSEIQALWAIAYLEGDLQLPDLQEMEKEVAEVNAWTRRRYLNLGEKCPNLTFEYLAYMDTLLQDLGIETQRKRGLFRRILEEHTAKDYKDVVETWMQRQRAKKE